MYKGFTIELSRTDEQLLRSYGATSVRRPIETQISEDDMPMALEYSSANCLMDTWFKDYAADVFVSHSSRDAELAGGFAALLGSVGLRVFVDSISNPENYLLSDECVRLESLMCLSQDIAQSVLKRGARILYGGDLRSSDEDGFTAFILDEAKVVSNREGKSRKYVRNFLAWPIYVKQEDSKVAFQARYANLVDWVNVAPPPDLNRIGGFDKNVRIKRDTPEHAYCIARSLTAMRIKAIKESSCRICVRSFLCSEENCSRGVDVWVARKTLYRVFRSCELCTTYPTSD